MATAMSGRGSRLHTYKVMLFIDLYFVEKILQQKYDILWATNLHKSNFVSSFTMPSLNIPLHITRAAYGIKLDGIPPTIATKSHGKANWLLNIFTQIIYKHFALCAIYWQKIQVTEQWCITASETIEMYGIPK